MLKKIEKWIDEHPEEALVGGVLIGFTFYGLMMYYSGFNAAKRSIDIYKPIKHAVMGSVMLTEEEMLGAEKVLKVIKDAGGVVCRLDG